MKSESRAGFEPTAQQRPVAPSLDQRLRDVPTPLRQVHLVAVGGVGMGALAGMFRQRGVAVTGSDETIYPPMSLVLERLGIDVRSGYRAENLDDGPDLVVIGNKVSRSNPEVEAVLTRGLPYISFPEAMARYFLAGHRSLVVAGTHGKTTSTAMLAWVLTHAGRDPGLMIGGESIDFGGNFKLGYGEFFVIEGDEYDTAFFDKGPKFLHYQPAAVLLTGVEFDHADIYRDLDAVKDAFRSFVHLVPAGAPLVVASDFPAALDCVGAARAAVTTFGCESSAEWRITDLRDNGQSTRFTVRRGERAEGELALTQPGVINASNALGVYVLARCIGLAHGEIADALRCFSGVRRRQELIGEFNGVTLIDDFAHHPTAVAGTLAALRQRYPQRRLWALFEPRSNSSRRRVFQADYLAALARADAIVVGAVVQKELDRVDRADLFSPEQLVDELRARGKLAYTGGSADAITAMVGGTVVTGDVIVMMSNGDFGGLRARLVQQLQRRETAS